MDGEVGAGPGLVRRKSVEVPAKLAKTADRDGLVRGVVGSWQGVDESTPGSRMPRVLTAQLVSWMFVPSLASSAMIGGGEGGVRFW